MTAGIFHSQQFCFYCSVFSSMSAAHVGSLGFFDIMGSACNAHGKTWWIRVGAEFKERKVNLCKTNLGGKINFISSATRFIVADNVAITLRKGRHCKGFS